MNSLSERTDFNPSGVGLKNGNFIGLPYNETTANIILVPVPWDVTVSFGEGTASGPQAILDASVQLDLYDPDVQDAWKLGIYMEPVDQEFIERKQSLRVKAAAYIDFIEKGDPASEDRSMQQLLDEVNVGCDEMNKWVYTKTRKIIEAGKTVGLVGGDHSVPLGYLQALGEKYESFGVLHIDAHMDLRNSYEGFTWSHASIFYNALQQQQISKLVQVSIRDFCDEEMEVVQEESKRIKVFTDFDLKENSFLGVNWNEQCGKIIEELPQLVYVSFDMDGLDPKLCPHTGTPVPGGLEFQEAIFLLKKLAESGRKIIGFDVCETGNHPWDANVGARIIYKLSNLSGLSLGLI
jgi:agmatinase